MSRHLIALLLLVGVAAGCTAPPARVVEVQVPVTVPGPVRYREVPADLLTCPDRPAELRDGITGGELVTGARGWQAYARCLEGRIEEIGKLPTLND